MTIENNYLRQSTSHYQLRVTKGAITIVIPSRKDWLQLVFLLLSLVGWVIVGILVGGMLGTILFSHFSEVSLSAGTSGDFASITYLTVFFLGFLSIWGILGTTRFYAVLWHLFGKEVITVSNDSLTLRRQVLFLGRDHVYQARKIKGLRFALLKKKTDGRWSTESLWRFGIARIAFDFDGKTYRFGDGLSETEAEQIIARIWHYLVSPTNVG